VPRSLKKRSFIDLLLKKVEARREKRSSSQLRLGRAVLLSSLFCRVDYRCHNGRQHVPVIVTRLVGHKLGIRSERKHIVSIRADQASKR